MTIESVEKMREWAKRFGPMGSHDPLMFADEIEREVAERFCKLPEGWMAEQASEVLGYWPRWDDGTPCMFGDEFTCYPKYCHEQKYEVLDRLSIFGQNHVWNRGCDNEMPHDGGYYEWNYMRPGGDGCESYGPTKRKPRTLEDVLADFAKDVNVSHSDFVSADGEEAYLLAAINETADEIRELMEVDA